MAVYKRILLILLLFHLSSAAEFLVEYDGNIISQPNRPFGTRTKPDFHDDADETIKLEPTIQTIDSQQNTNSKTEESANDKGIYGRISDGIFQGVKRRRKLAMDFITRPGNLMPSDHGKGKGDPYYGKGKGKGKGKGSSSKSRYRDPCDDEDDGKGFDEIMNFSREAKESV